MMSFKITRSTAAIKDITIIGAHSSHHQLLIVVSHKLKVTKTAAVIDANIVIIACSLLANSTPTDLIARSDGFMSLSIANRTLFWKLINFVFARD